VLVIGARKNENFGLAGTLGTSGAIGALSNVIGKYGLLVAMILDLILLNFGGTRHIRTSSALLSFARNFIHYIVICEDFFDVCFSVVDFSAYAGKRECSIGA
jgi:hypothetical protein